jgi:dTDP-4-dehydrorhamnose reductase
VTFSSDLVFDGTASQPYVESDRPGPLSHYGRSKHAAEELLARLHPQALVVRTGVVFGPWDESNFLTTMLRRLAAGHSVPAASEFIVSPVYVPDLVDTVLDLLIDDERGVWHLVNTGSVSWYEWAGRSAAAADYSPERIIPGTPADLGWIAPRPRSAALTSERTTLLPHWEHALERYVAATPWLHSRVAA